MNFEMPQVAVLDVDAKTNIEDQDRAPLPALEGPGLVPPDLVAEPPEPGRGKGRGRGYASRRGSPSQLAARTPARMEPIMVHPTLARLVALEHARAPCTLVRGAELVGLEPPRIRRLSV